ncbi:hypothetical protein ACH5RR_013501 [Cinchona calisaya]|uniref:Uncharacterized protein n=1 Tax=Cinchona calisaya TaxID=153742 RepID=A0ABD3A0B5_9GENT
MDAWLQVKVRRLPGPGDFSPSWVEFEGSGTGTTGVADRMDRVKDRPRYADQRRIIMSVTRDSEAEYQKGNQWTPDVAKKEGIVKWEKTAC